MKANIVLMTDIEYGLIILVLLLLFIFGLKKREEKVSFIPLNVDKDFSSAIKGVACVMILLSHYGKRAFGFDVPIPMSISKVVWWSSANIALAWFMFFSGFGLSLKDDCKIVSIKKTLLLRIWKVYRPYIIVVIVTLIIAFFLPDSFSLEEMRARIMSTKPHYMHHLTEAMNLTYIYGLVIHSSWYVECIIWFYSIYYLSVWFSCKWSFNKTVVLSLLMLGYPIAAYYYFGSQEAHYYRYPCVFLVGHLAVRWRDAKWYGISIASGVILLNLAIVGFMYVVWFIVALIGLFIFSIINTRYTVFGKGILFMGSISYFYYLSHVDIAWTLLCYTSIQSCLAWTVLSIIVAFLLYKFNIVLGKTSFEKKYERESCILPSH